MIKEPVLFLGFLFFISLAGCKQPVPDAIVAPTMIKVDTGDITYFKYIDSCIDQIHFVALQTVKESPIGEIRKISLTDQDIVLLDKTGQHTVFLFRRNGQFVKALKSPGNNYINDFAIRENKILLFLNDKKRVEVFDGDGNHLEGYPINKDLLAAAFEDLGANVSVFYNNTIPVKTGNYRLMVYDDYRKFREGFLPFDYDVSKNVNPYTLDPLYKSETGSVRISQVMDDTIHCLKDRGDHLSFYPGFILKFQDRPLPPGFLNNKMIGNLYKQASEGRYSFYLRGFMDMDSLVMFSYIHDQNTLHYIWNKHRSEPIANCVELWSSKFGIKLPDNLQQVGPDLAVGYYHSYELIDWAKANKQKMADSSLLAIADHLSELDNPVITLISYHAK